MKVRRLFRFARIPLAVAVVWGLYLMRVNVWFRLYPVFMVALALFVFAISLRRTPLVERIARDMGHALDARGVSYCRSVTWFWVLFLTVHLAVTLATVFASREVWVFYNGFLAYVLIGFAFIAEWVCRRRILRNG